MIENRSRILINKNKRHIIFANFKCGFSSVNRAVIEDDSYDNSIKNGKELFRWRKSNNIEDFELYLVSRNPYDRFLSFYFNWIVDKDEFFTIGKNPKLNENWAFRNLKNFMSEAEFEKFKKSSPAERASADLFDQFVKYLPSLFDLNPHTYPQSRLYLDAELNIDNFKVIIDIAQISSQLSPILGTEIPHGNRSSNKDEYRNKLVKGRAAEIINTIYEKDFVDLGYELIT